MRQPAEFEPDLTYRRQHPRKKFMTLISPPPGRGRRRLPPPPQAFSGIVSRKIVSVSTKIIYVLRRLYKREPVAYDALFGEARNKSELVATFLALLELIKAKRIPGGRGRCEPDGADAGKKQGAGGRGRRPGHRELELNRKASGKTWKSSNIRRRWRPFCLPAESRFPWPAWPRCWSWTRKPPCGWPRI